MSTMRNEGMKTNNESMNEVILIIKDNKYHLLRGKLFSANRFK